MRILKKAKWLCVLLALLPSASWSQTTPGKLRVVASFSILGDIVREVGGDAINLTTLVGPGSDVHIYTPTPTDAKILADAQLLIINGVNFESWLDKLVRSTGYTAPVVTATKDIVPLKLEGNISDPHAWQDLANAKFYVETIRDELIRADTANAKTYQENAARYLKQVQDLDVWVRAQIDSVPAQKRRFITSHNAFGYFAKAYGVTIISAQPVSTQGDPSAADIAKLIDQVRRQGVRAVFMENITDPRIIWQLERDAGAKVGGTLYSDALSDSEGPAPSYLALMKHNVTLMVAGMKD